MGKDANLYISKHDTIPHDVDWLRRELPSSEVAWVKLIEKKIWVEGEEGGIAVNIEIGTMYRYYDESYPRGKWPLIRDLANRIESLFTDARIMCAPDDGSGPGYEMTRTRIAELDKYYAEHGNAQYSEYK